MEDMKYLYELFESMPRSGPGNVESTRRAIETIPELPEKPMILDIGCGQGVQATELARISRAKVFALDNHQPFLNLLEDKAGQMGLKNIETLNMSMFEMDFANSSFDLIWSEGALYIMGFRKGLRKCHEILKQEGYMAITELVLFEEDPPLELMEYLKGEYPDIRTVGDNISVIDQEGFDLISHFRLPDSAWFESFYDPMESFLEKLEKKYKGNAEAMECFKGMREEIDMYRKYSSHFGYEFFIMQKKR